MSKRNLFKRLFKIVKTWKEELWMFPVLAIGWFISPRLLHWIDPTAATYDAGIFQLIWFTLMAFMSFSAFVWIFIKLTFPEIWDYFNKHFYNDYKNSEPWVKLVVSLSLYCFLLLLLAIMFRVV